MKSLGGVVVNDLISVIIPCFNGAGTLERCLRGAWSQEDSNFEVIVVNDGSTDGSAEIAGKFPCKLLNMEEQGGAAHARNCGAAVARGQWLFFTDADCILPRHTLRNLRRALQAHDMDHMVLGGSYTLISGDRGFFNEFQSVFVHYHETRPVVAPDYLATHALAISATCFARSGGFREDLLPILEDVEYSHRLRRQGLVLKMVPDILVRHIFGFSLAGSLANALRKTRHWVVYSLSRRDLLADSGAASRPLKLNVASFYLCLLLLAVTLVLEVPGLMVLIVLIMGANLWCNRGLAGAMLRAAGSGFAIPGMLYYSFVYPLPIGMGGMLGVKDFLRNGPCDRLR